MHITTQPGHIILNRFTILQYIQISREWMYDEDDPGANSNMTDLSNSNANYTYTNDSDATSVSELTPGAASSGARRSDSSPANTSHKSTFSITDRRASRQSTREGSVWSGIIPLPFLQGQFQDEVDVLLDAIRVSFSSSFLTLGGGALKLTGLAMSLVFHVIFSCRISGRKLAQPFTIIPFANVLPVECDTSP